LPTESRLELIPLLVHFVGLDLGQVRDFTALAVLERPLVGPHDALARRRPAYALRHLQRFPLGTPYPAVVQGVLTLLRGALLSDPTLAVDQTGVGRAVVDLLADALRGPVSCLVFPMTLTAGHAVTGGEAGGLYVPKKELIGTLQLLLQTRRLQVARSLTDAAVLKELENYRIKVTTARNETFESWREGPHDDLVLAVAMAAWLGEQALTAPGEGPDEPVFEQIIVA
jgi:hypothetical protein